MMIFAISRIYSVTTSLCNLHWVSIYDVIPQFIWVSFEGWSCDVSTLACSCLPMRLRAHMFHPGRWLIFMMMGSFLPADVFLLFSIWLMGRHRLSQFSCVVWIYNWIPTSKWCYPRLLLLNCMLNYQCWIRPIAWCPSWLRIFANNCILSTHHVIFRTGKCIKPCGMAHYLYRFWTTLFGMSLSCTLRLIVSQGKLTVETAPIVHPPIKNKLCGILEVIPRSFIWAVGFFILYF